LLAKVFRFVLALIGFAIGYSIFSHFQVIPSALFPQWGYDIPAIVGAFLFGLICFLFAPLVSTTLGNLGHWLERALLVVPGQDMVAGTVGIIIGLLIGTLLTYPFRVIPFIGDYLPIISNLLLAWVGMMVAIKKREDILGMFRLSRTSAEGSAKEKGAGLVKILDTSVIIDGRIADICDAGFLDGKIVIPSFVLEELRHIADSSDALKRNRGRRGLDILNRIQKEINIPVHVVDDNEDEGLEVDSRLVKLAQRMGGKVVTNDYNLNKVCELQRVPVLNINELANAVKPVVLPGEEMDVQIIKDGKESGQGIAYLDDGTMIVVDGGRSYIGDEIPVLVTSVLQTAAGRMIFARLKHEKIS
jgi:uncharacterized protein YacL